MKQLRDWQTAAIEAWRNSGCRGIAAVVTGGGKTIFALACAAEIQPVTTLVVVPTHALLDQWWEEIADYFSLALDEIHILKGRSRIRSGTFNLAVLNTASAITSRLSCKDLFLVVDECHKAASDKFREIFAIQRVASLGLSATPDRPYDQGLHSVLVPQLGPLIYSYTYADALRDNVIVPFKLRNVVFDLESDRQQAYDRVTKAIALSVRKHGFDSQETVSLLLKRARIVNLSFNRIKLAARLVLANSGSKTIVFHEDIHACDFLRDAIVSLGLGCKVYHSGCSVRERVSILAEFRRGDFNVLVSCRALDEGFNVPEAEVGIIAASTATRRQRIQRLGRVLRPAKGKESATVYTLVTTHSEIARLKDEEEELDGVASITWSSA